MCDLAISSRKSVDHKPFELTKLVVDHDLGRSKYKVGVATYPYSFQVTMSCKLGEQDFIVAICASHYLMLSKLPLICSLTSA